MNEHITNEGAYQFDEELLKKVAEDLTARGIEEPSMEDVKTTDIFGYCRKKPLPVQSLKDYEDKVLKAFETKANLHIESDGTPGGTLVRAGKDGPILSGITKINMEIDAEDVCVKATVEFFLLTTDITVLQENVTRKLNVERADTTHIVPDNPAGPPIQV